MHGRSRTAGWAAVAIAALALAGCNTEKLRKAGLLDEPRRPIPEIGVGDPCWVPPPPEPCPPPPPPPPPPCFGPPRSYSCGAATCPPTGPNEYEFVGIHEYAPMVPVADTRAAMTTLVLAPSPWLLTSGDPTTPQNGRATLRWQRISDERDLADFDGNVWASDGEVQAVTLEYVSPRISFGPSRCAAPICVHLGASVHAYTLTTAVFDGLRNAIEEGLLNSDEAVRDMHDIGGRELSLNGEDLLESTLWKAKGIVKMPLPDLQMESTRLQGSFSVGVTSPAFGADRDSGNEDVQVDATLAFSLPLSRFFRLVGGASVLFPGSAPAYDDVDLEVETIVPSARLALEWWMSRRFAAMVGISYYGHYTTDSGLPTDGDSTFVDIGFLYRINEHWDIHLFGAENPQTEIITNPGGDFGNSQRDADFTIGLGVGWTF
jgi:hypothetical protein